MVFLLFLIGVQAHQEFKRMHLMSAHAEERLGNLLKSIVCTAVSICLMLSAVALKRLLHNVMMSATVW